MTRVNLVCLVGAVLALVSVALPWGLQTPAEVTVTGHHPPSSPIYLTDTMDFLGNRDMLSLAAVMLIGAIFSMLTPLGGCLQLSGVIYYYSLIWNHIGFVPSLGFGYGSYFWLGLGFYTAVAASAVTLVSMLWPVGFEYSGLYYPFSRRRLSPAERLLVWPLNGLAKKGAPEPRS